MTERFEKVVDDIVQRLGANNVLLGNDIGERYQGDWSGVNLQRPIAVFRPANTADVAHIMAVCHSAGQSVVVQGGMTGLCAGATPQLNEIAISLERMSAIEEIDSLSMTMTVLAGTPLASIQDSANEAGFRFPLDLGARGSCTIGGNISTNAGGNQVIQFGMTRNLILGLEVVLPDGTILTSLNKMLKNNAGYDLKHLFIGTEGTLGIVTRAVLRLYPRPLTKLTALCALNSLQDTIKLLRHLTKSLGGGLGAYEVMWSDYVDYASTHISGLNSPFDGRFDVYVLVEYEGVRPETDANLFEEALHGVMEAGLVSDAVLAQSEREAKNLWRLRDAIGDIFQQLKNAISFDISAPIGSIPEMLELISQDLHLSFGEIVKLTYGHLGDSNIHLTVATGKQSDTERISEIVYQRTGLFHGSISGEHGIGVTKKKYLTLSRGDSEIEVMRKLKVLFDPKGILNPNRVLP